ncbi:hypothetical protein FRC18_002443 [Serendipita sp. 400]|nr:hypothetical protein FRC18_002443 [Serendipita sp. 400]
MSSEKESTSLVKGPSGVEMAEGPGDTHTQLGSNFVDARELQYRVHIPGGYANGKTMEFTVTEDDDLESLHSGCCGRCCSCGNDRCFTGGPVCDCHAVDSRRRTFETQSSNIVPSFVYQQLTDDRILYM